MARKHPEVFEAILQNKAKWLKQHLDTLIIDHMLWIEHACQSEGYDPIKYQRFYIDELEKREIYAEDTRN